MTRRMARPLTRQELAALFPWTEAPTVPPSAGYRRAFPLGGFWQAVKVVGAAVVIVGLMWATVTAVALL